MAQEVFKDPRELSQSMVESVKRGHVPPKKRGPKRTSEEVREGVKKPLPSQTPKVETDENGKPKKEKGEL